MSRFTTFFQIVPANTVRVAGLTTPLPAPAAPASNILTSIAGLYAISADTAALLARLAPTAEPLRLAA